MRPILQPGTTLPAFSLPATNLDRPSASRDLLGQVAVVVFFPFAARATLAGQLSQYQEKLPDFAAQKAQVVAISDGPLAELRSWAAENGLSFPLLSDGEPRGGTANRCGAVDSSRLVLPAVFVADEEGLIRRVYEPDPEGGLPNPAMVRRAIVNLSQAPKQPPIGPGDWQRGTVEAPVVLVEYADYQCGYCQETYRAIEEVLPAYGDTLCLIYRHFLLRRTHPLAQEAAEAAEAAGAQGRFWEMHGRLFEAGGALERDNLLDYAGEIGLDVGRFIDDLDAHRFAPAIEAGMQSAVAGKVKGPPTLFVNGIVFDGPRTAPALRERIERLLACLS